MKKYLRCHTEGKKHVGLEVGKRYEVIYEREESYCISGFGHYTKEPDSKGLSYRTWFTLEIEGDDDDMTKVLVADASIGGVLREYIKVVRKANIGEMVIVTNPQHDADKHGGYVVGDVAKVVDTDVDSYATYYGAVTDYGKTFQLYAEEYQVLEPTGNVDVGGKLFRLVKRKAETGEEVLVTSIVGANSSGGQYYKLRNTGKVIRTTPTGSGSVWTDLTSNKNYYGDGKWWVSYEDYHVLEKVAEGVKEVETPTALEYSMRFAKLEARVSALEAQLEARKLTEVLPSKCETAQEIRDRTVDEAKELVKEIEDKLYGCWYRSPYEAHRKHGPLVVEFVVNRDKRRVTAVLRLKHIDTMVVGTGRANCVEGDVFNEHIGKAIALLKALGEDVPHKFKHAPNPTEIRLGNIVQFNGGKNGATYEVAGPPTTAEDALTANLKIVTAKVNIAGAKAYGADFEGAQILDDSKSEVFA